MKIRGKNLLLIALKLLFILIGCKDFNKKEVKEIKMPHTNVLVKEKSFVLIKNIIDNEKDKIKAYFDFPIISDDIWYKVLGDNQEKYSDKEFNKKDFDIYFNQLFTNEFKQCLSKIDFDQLSIHKHYETEYIHYKENDYQVKSNVSIILLDNELKIEFRSLTQVDAKEYEHTEIFTFALQNCQLKFVSFTMAG